jgi:hypothetical protein
MVALVEYPRERIARRLKNFTLASAPDGRYLTVRLVLLPAQIARSASGERANRVKSHGHQWEELDKRVNGGEEVTDVANAVWAATIFGAQDPQACFDFEVIDRIVLDDWHTAFEREYGLVT